jgi:hypothetical protein
VRKKFLNKFAPLTADLFARKGEAAPSLDSKRVLDWTHGLRAPLLFLTRQEDTASSRPRPRPDCGRTQRIPDGRKSRRIVLSFTAGEFEGLGIAAAKKDMTRHELVQAAIRNYFNLISGELEDGCLCLSGEKNAPCDSHNSETGS